jgi:hypothetical protein
LFFSGTDNVPLNSFAAPAAPLKNITFGVPGGDKESTPSGFGKTEAFIL